MKSGLLIMLGITIVFLVSGCTQIEKLDGITTRITNNGMSITPALYDNIIAYHRYDTANSFSGLTIYDINTGNSFDISSPITFNLEIFKNNIVWNNGTYVLAYDIDNSEMHTISEGETPDIYENLVVFIRDEGVADDKVVLYDLGTKTEKIIYSGTYLRTSKIFGDYIIFKDNDDIYAYQISTSNNRRIGISRTPYDDTIGIYDNLVVWSEGTAQSDFKIYIYNLLTNEKTTLDTETESIDWISIYEDKIAWEGVLPSGKYIKSFVYDINENKDYIIDSEQGVRHPYIFENKIAFTKFIAESETDIFIVELND